jgi:plastocyanin
VTAASLGEANGVAGDAVLRVGETLHLPEDAWGSAPPDTRNPGTACTQYTLSKSVYEGIVNPKPDPTRPASAASQVAIQAHANDWTMTADGQAQPANEGVALVPAGTTVQFTNAEGLHTITVNGTKDGADFTQGQTRTFTFSEANARYKITCNYHPDMLAWVFTQ